MGNVKYWSISSKTSYPKFPFVKMDTIDFATTVFPTIGKVSKCNYGSCLSMSEVSSAKFDKLFDRKTFVRCSKEAIINMTDFVHVVDHNKGEVVRTGVVSRYFIYRDDFAHMKAMAAAGTVAVASGIAIGRNFPTASRAIKNMSLDHLTVDHGLKMIVIQETLATNSVNVVKLMDKKRSTYSLVAFYFMNYRTEIEINGFQVVDPSQSVIETEPTMDVTGLVKRFTDMEVDTCSFGGYAEARKLLLEAADDESYVLKESAYSAFIKCVAEKTTSLPKAAHLTETYNNASKDVPEDNDFVTTSVEEDSMIEEVKAEFGDLDTTTSKTGLHL